MQRHLFCSFLVWPFLLSAQPGTLDPTFGSGGISIQDLTSIDDEVHAVVVQPDGKTVGAGWTDDGNTAITFVQRLRMDGSPDPDFGTGGVTYSPGAGELRYAYAVDLQSTGNIVVAGLVYDGSFDGNAMLLRYLPDGAPDPSFGTGGYISLDYGASFGFQSAWAMHILDDDRIVLLGEEGENGVACVRLTSEGALDDTFGTNGLALTGLPFSSGLCLDVYPDGAVITGGYRVDGDSDWLLARFDANGILDPAFGTGGIATLDIGGGDTEFMRGVDVLPDGRIAACGSRGSSGLDDEPVVALFSPTGDPDPLFGTGGLLVLPYTAPQWGQARGLIAQPDNKLLIGGFRAQPGAPENNDFFLFRLMEDGSFDPGFEGGGQVHTDVSGSYDRAFDMALAPDGAIVLAGFGTGSGRASVYTRYINDIGTSIPTNAAPTGAFVFPQPATDRVFISTTSDPATPRTASLFAMDGTRLMSDLLLTDGSGNGGWLPLPSHLRSGTYVVEVRTASCSLRTKLLVIRD